MSSNLPAVRDDCLRGSTAADLRIEVELAQFQTRVRVRPRRVNPDQRRRTVCAACPVPDVGTMSVARRRHVKSLEGHDTPRQKGREICREIARRRNFSRRMKNGVPVVRDKKILVKDEISSHYADGYANAN